MTEEYEWLQSCFSYIQRTEDSSHSNKDDIEWLKCFLTLEPITCFTRQEKLEIHQKYQALLAFFKFTQEKYVELYRIQHAEISSQENLSCLSYILQRKGLDPEIRLFLLHPEFAWDLFVYHRISTPLCQEDLDRALQVMDLFEQFYYSIVNHLEVMMARPPPQFSNSV